MSEAFREYSGARNPVAAGYGGYQPSGQGGGIMGTAGPKATSGLQMILEQYERQLGVLAEVRQRMERTLNHLGAPIGDPPKMELEREKKDAPENLSARYNHLTDILRQHGEAFRILADRLEGL